MGVGLLNSAWQCMFTLDVLESSIQRQVPGISNDLIIDRKQNAPFYMLAPDNWFQLLFLRFGDSRQSAWTFRSLCWSQSAFLLAGNASILRNCAAIKLNENTDSSATTRWLGITKAKPSEFHGCQCFCGGPSVPSNYALSSEPLKIKYWILTHGFVIVVQTR